MADSAPAPQIPCTQCDEIMRVYVQPLTLDDAAAHFVTCLNESCAMYGYTLAAANYPPQDLDVYLNVDKNRDVLQLYLSLVRRESRQAALAIEQIQDILGAQAALRAALAITIFRMEVKQYRRIPDIAVYTYLIRDYPEAVSLLESAMEWCLQNWGIRNLHNIHLNMDHALSPDTEFSPSNPESDE